MKDTTKIKAQVISGSKRFTGGLQSTNVPVAPTDVIRLKDLNNSSSTPVINIDGGTSLN